MQKHFAAVSPLPLAVLVGGMALQKQHRILGFAIAYLGFARLVLYFGVHPRAAGPRDSFPCDITKGGRSSDLSRQEKAGPRI